MINHVDKEIYFTKNGNPYDDQEDFIGVSFLPKEMLQKLVIKNKIQRFDSIQLIIPICSFERFVKLRFCRYCHSCFRHIFTEKTYITRSFFNLWLCRGRQVSGQLHGGRGHWAVYYTSPQSFVITFFNSIVGTFVEFGLVGSLR